MNYYNEFNAKAAAWLRELIKDGLIPDGEVDERSIIDVRADDLRGFTQCHFFAGVGGWSLALKMAGIQENFKCWTGSCPCQPFSNAGKKKGMSDERDLWPVFERLIAEVKPQHVFGEQVASAIKLGWIDRVHSDLEREGYACGEVVLGAHSIGAPHIRQRLYWGAARMALPQGCGHLEREHRNEAGEESANDRGRQKGVRISDPSDASASIGLAQDSASLGRRGRSNGNPAGDSGQVQAQGLGDDGGLSDSDSPGQRELCRGESVSPEFASTECAGLSGFSPWSDFGLVLCRDTDKQGRHRVRRVPAESILQRVADGVPESVDELRYQSICESPEKGFPLCKKGAVEGHNMLLAGYGNAIVPQCGAAFIEEFLESINPKELI